MAAWSPGVVTMVDLDLDVVLPHAGDAYVDDEDEFAAHRISYGYPPDVVDAAQDACATVLQAVSVRRPPFDPTTARRWLARLTG